jgi:hypothetical protein
MWWIAGWLAAVAIGIGLAYRGASKEKARAQGEWLARPQEERAQMWMHAIAHLKVQAHNPMLHPVQRARAARALKKLGFR